MPGYSGPAGRFLEIWLERPHLDSLAAPLREAAAAPLPAEVR